MGSLMAKSMTNHMGAKMQREKEQKEVAAAPPPSKDWVGLWVSLSHPIQYIRISPTGIFSWKNTLGS